MCWKATGDSHIQLLRCWAVNRRVIPSITIIYNRTHYLPASKHPVYTICNELKSDEKNQDLFELQHDCQVDFHLWKPFISLRDFRGKYMMKKPRNSLAVTTVTDNCQVFNQEFTNTISFLKCKKTLGLCQFPFLAPSSLCLSGVLELGTQCLILLNRCWLQWEMFHINVYFNINPQTKLPLYPERKWWLVSNLHVRWFLWQVRIPCPTVRFSVAVPTWKKLSRY